MKASVFIKVALIDQMQQIADLGLWFHLYHLLGKGIKTLGDTACPRPVDKFEVYDPFGYAQRVLLGGKYAWLPAFEGGSFVSGNTPQIWLYSNDEDANKNATFDEAGIYRIHVPSLFADFLSACKTVLDKIAAQEIPDIDALVPREEADTEERRMGNVWGGPKPNACYVCGKRAVVRHEQAMIGGIIFGLCEDHKNYEASMEVPGNVIFSK